MSAKAEPARNELLDAALRYEKFGIPVFPLRPGRKEPITRHSFYDASGDPAHILAWWRRDPAANIGTPTGKDTFLVIDIDPRNGGNLELLERNLGLKCPNFFQRTGHKGGLHLFFRGEDITSRVLLPGVELKGAGSYIVLAPSQLRGRCSKCTPPHDFGTAEHPGKYVLGKPMAVKFPKLTPLPDCLRSLVKWSGQKETRTAPPITGKIPEGSRNITLASLAGTMRRRGFSEAAIRTALLEENRLRCVPPVDEGEVGRIAQSIARYKPEGAVIQKEPTNGESQSAVPLLVAPKQETPYSFAPSFPPGHFVTEYITYASGRTDAAHEYHEGAALVLIANATAGIRARLSAYTNGLPTNLYGLNVGDSTTSRKSTAQSIAKDLLERAIPNTLMAEQFSPEGFIEQLARRSPGASCWLVDEFSEMLDKLHHAKFMAGFRGLLLTVYDGNSYEYRRHSKRIKGGDTEEDFDRINRPHLSILGATTPAIFDTLSDKDVISGLIPRFFPIMPDKKPERMPFYETGELIESQRSKLVFWLGRIHDWSSKKRTVSFEPEALKKIDAFSEGLERNSQSYSEAQRTMVHRLTGMAMKVAMLSTAGGGEKVLEGERLNVTSDDADAAIRVANRWQTYALRFVERIGESKFERTLMKCAALAKKKGTVSRREIARRAHVEKRVLDGVEATLIDRGAIEVVQTETGGRPSVEWEWLGAK